MSTFCLVAVNIQTAVSMDEDSAIVTTIIVMNAEMCARRHALVTLVARLNPIPVPLQRCSTSPSQRCQVEKAIKNCFLLNAFTAHGGGFQVDTRHQSELTKGHRSPELAAIKWKLLRPVVLSGCFPSGSWSPCSVLFSQFGPSLFPLACRRPLNRTISRMASRTFEEQVSPCYATMSCHWVLAQFEGKISYSCTRCGAHRCCPRACRCLYRCQR